jgi:hypothetical protein
MNKQLAILSIALLGAMSVQAADLVVIVNNGATAPTKEVVADVYLGKSQAFVPHDLPESAPARAEFYQKATGRDLVQVKSVWSRIVFSGKGQAPAEHPDAAAVKKAVAADPKAIGYIEKSALDGTIKALN